VIEFDIVVRRSGEAGLDAGRVERRTALGRRRLELRAPRGVVGGRVQQRPRARGRHVDAGREELHVVGDRCRVLFRALRGVHHAVDAGTEDGVDVVGRGDADGVDARELTGVAAFLVGAVHPHPDQLEVGPPLDGGDGDRADAAGAPHGDAHGSG
jgi:hypothetical protein